VVGAHGETKTKQEELNFPDPRRGGARRRVNQKKPQKKESSSQGRGQYPTAKRLYEILDTITCCCRRKGKEEPAHVLPVLLITCRFRGNCHKRGNREKLCPDGWKRDDSLDADLHQRILLAKRKKKLLTQRSNGSNRRMRT